MDVPTTTAAITREVSAVLAGTGIVVDDVEIRSAGRRRLVRVLLARDVSGLGEDTTSPVEPLDLDEVADATRAVSDVLDAGDLLGQGAYTLEVSSTGLDRPLTTPDQFRRNVGRLVKLTFTDGTTRTDRIVEVAGDRFTLDGDPSPLALEDVRTARVQVEFSRPDRKDA